MLKWRTVTIVWSAASEGTRLAIWPGAATLLLFDARTLTIEFQFVPPSRRALRPHSSLPSASVCCQCLAFICIIFVIVLSYYWWISRLIFFPFECVFLKSFQFSLKFVQILKIWICRVSLYLQIFVSAKSKNKTWRWGSHFNLKYNLNIYPLLILCWKIIITLYSILNVSKKIKDVTYCQGLPWASLCYTHHVLPTEGYRPALRLNCSRLTEALLSEIPIYTCQNYFTHSSLAQNCKTHCRECT